MLFMIIILPICLITATNPVVSVLCLVGTSSLLAVYWFITGLTLISILYILVYVGAVAILFLFVIMTLDVRELELVDSNWSKHLPPAGLITAAIVVTLLSNLSTLESSMNINTINVEINKSNIELVGASLYGYNCIQLIVMVLVLLCAMICPLCICMKGRFN